MPNLFKQIVIPLTLNNDIQGLAISSIQKDKCLHFIDLMIVASNREFGLPFCFTSFSKDFFLVAFNSKYQKFIKPLKESGIIECDEVFSAEGGKSHYYKLDKYHFCSEQELVKVQVKYKALDYEVSGVAEQNTIDFIKSLYIPYNELYQALDQKIYDTINQEYLENYGINEEFIQVSDGIKKYYISRNKAIIKATKLKLTLFKDNEKFYILDKSEYRKIKLNNIKCSYRATIENLKKGYFYASRNRTNQRLDSNLTNMPGCLFNIISQKNKLKQVDAVNSQYAILANIMKNNGLVGRFIEDAENGKLYENIVKELNLPDRDTAKKGLMQIIFSPATIQNNLKKGLKKIYPELIAYTDMEKIENGYKSLSIKLQKHESNLYVDGLSSGLQAMGIDCSTKHDSIICRESDFKNVEIYIKKELMQRDFICQLKAS